MLLVFAMMSSASATAAEVMWNVFSIGHYDMGNGVVGHSIQYYADITPEVGFTIAQKNARQWTITFDGFANVGANDTFWARATAGTILSWDWRESAKSLLDMGTGNGPGTITLGNNQTAYIAVFGDSWSSDPTERYYTGWVEIRNTAGEISIDSSALAYDSLEVGTGTIYPGLNATPEPLSAVLLLLGLSVLGLRRKLNK